MTDEGAGDRVDLLDAVAVLEGVASRLHPRVAPQAVGDKAWRVFGDHAALAQEPLSEGARGLNDLSVRLGGRDDLHQLKVARRVEEVRPQEALLEVLRTTLGDAAQRDAGGVGGDDGGLLGDLLDARHEPLLRLQLLDDRLEDPVRLRDPAEVVVEVAEAYPLGDGLAHEVRRLGLLHPLVTGLHDGVLVVAFPRRDVQKVYFQAGVGAVGGDGRAHRPRSKYRDPFDPMHSRAPFP